MQCFITSLNNLVLLPRIRLFSFITRGQGVRNPAMEANLRQSEKMQVWETFLRNETIRTDLRQIWDLSHYCEKSSKAQSETNTRKKWDSVKTRKRQNRANFFLSGKHIPALASAVSVLLLPLLPAPRRLASRHTATSSRCSQPQIPHKKTAFGVQLAHSTNFCPAYPFTVSS